MRKFILAFTLSLLFISFLAFLYNAYILQNDYFNSKNNEIIEEFVPEKMIKEPLSIYKDYSKEDYDKAIFENRITVLFFNSNWCSQCIEQDKLNKSVFGEMSMSGVVGFNIHILDSETTDETDALAKKFEVKKENTYVFLDKNGAVSSKHVGELTEEILISNIMKAGDIK